MYEYLSGTISELAPTHAVLDVGGGGDFLQISLQTYSEIEHSDRVKLFVHYVVREDAQLLYGFASKAERELFRHLISVSGVGGNTARMILSTYSPRELQGIIATENAVLLKNVKGLGLKTAQKIIVELSGKMAGLGLTGDTVTAPVAGGDYEEALAALGAEFEPEQQKLVLCRAVPYVPDARIVPYRPEYRAQYLALHTVDRYWTGEKVLAAPEVFRVLLALEAGEAAGYIDLTHNSTENEPYDLFVREKSRRRGLGRALLAAAVQENRPNGMTLLVDIDNEAAIALYEAQGFERADGENNITAHICL